MRANRGAKNCEAEGPKRVETIQFSSELEDRLGALANHVVAEEHPAEKKRQMFR